MDKINKLKFEAVEKMKRRCLFMDMEAEQKKGELIKVTVVEINKEQKKGDDKALPLTT